MQIGLEEWPDGVSLPMWGVHRADRPPGPAGRWLIDRLTETVGQCIAHGKAERISGEAPRVLAASA